MLMILCFQGEGVFILKKDDDEEPIKVVKSLICFVSCLKDEYIYGCLQSYWELLLPMSITVLLTDCYFFPYKGLPQKGVNKAKTKKKKLKVYELCEIFFSQSNSVTLPIGIWAIWDLLFTGQ